MVWPSDIPCSIHYCCLSNMSRERESKQRLVIILFTPREYQFKIGIIPFVQISFAIELISQTSNSVVANKETAFLHAITTAGILQEILSKCDANKITECSCNKKRRQSRGCSEKLLFAEKMTLSLLATERQGNDERRTIDKDNKKVGIQVNVFVFYLFVYCI